MCSNCPVCQSVALMVDVYEDVGIYWESIICIDCNAEVVKKPLNIEMITSEQLLAQSAAEANESTEYQLAHTVSVTDEQILSHINTKRRISYMN